MAFVGNLPFYDHRKKNWYIYKQEMTEFMTTNHITMKKSAVMTTFLCTDTYELLCELAKTRDVTSLKYHQLVSLFDDHFLKKGGTHIKGKPATIDEAFRMAVRKSCLVQDTQKCAEVKSVLPPKKNPYYRKLAESGTENGSGVSVTATATATASATAKTTATAARSDGRVVKPRKKNKARPS